MSAPKWPPVHPIAQRIALPDGDPVDLYVYPGLTYILGLRGDRSGATFESVSLLRDFTTGEPDEDSSVPLDLFGGDNEDTFITSGDLVRITRTGGAGDLTLSLINVAL